MARYPVFFTDNGSPATGLSPTVQWRVLSSGLSPGAPPSVVEIDTVNQPGWYYFDANPPEQIVVTVDGGSSLATPDRYNANVISPDDFSATEARLVALDSPFTALKGAIADQVWDEPSTDHTSAGSMGLLLHVIASLSKANMRITAPTYDSDGRLLTCTLKVYENGSDASNDVNALGTYAVVASYDADGNLNTYVSYG